MAKTPRKGRKVTNGTQAVIEGTGPEMNKPVHEAALHYARERDARMAAGEDEKAAKVALIEKMNKAGLTHYEYGDLIVHIDSAQNVKVKTQAAQTGDDEE